MLREAPYHCNLLDADGMVPVSVRLAARTVADAIVMGNRLEREHPNCVGFEIRAGDRLVHTKAGPISRQDQFRER
jgi:hypothetical protein